LLLLLLLLMVLTGRFNGRVVQSHCLSWCKPWI